MVNKYREGYSRDLKMLDILTSAEIVVSELLKFDADTEYLSKAFTIIDI